MHLQQRQKTNINAVNAAVGSEYGMPCISDKTLLGGCKSSPTLANRRGASQPLPGLVEVKSNEHSLRQCRSDGGMQSRESKLLGLAFEWCGRLFSNNRPLLLKLRSHDLWNTCDRIARARRITFPPPSLLKTYLGRSCEEGAGWAC